MTNSETRLFLWLCLSFASSTAAASFSDSARGTSSAEFLTLGAGARAEGMGEAYGAMADEASAVYWNPAAMTRIENRSATFMHAPYLDSTFFDYAAYAQNLGLAAGAIGASVQYFSAGNIDQTDATGTTINSFNPYDLALALGYAHDLGAVAPAMEGYSVGLSLKFIQSRVLNSAQTGAVDLGMLSPSYLRDRLRWALTATNLGGRLQFDQVSESLPLSLRIATSYKLADRWTAALDLSLPKDDSPYAALGTEYWLPASGAWKFAARAGFNSETIGSIDGFTGLSFGFGIACRGFGFDYAILPMGGLGQAHRLSLTYNF